VAEQHGRGQRADQPSDEAQFHHGAQSLPVVGAPVETEPGAGECAGRGKPNTPTRRAHVCIGRRRDNAAADVGMLHKWVTACQIAPLPPRQAARSGGQPASSAMPLARLRPRRTGAKRPWPPRFPRAVLSPADRAPG
jgi:hypothetical protein